MLTYKYVARDKNGKRISNVATAQSASALIMRLKTEGLLPLRVDPAKSLTSSNKVGPFTLTKEKVKVKELMLFTRQLSAILNAGIILTEALDSIADEMDNKYFQKIINQIKEDIRFGSDFSSALAKHPKIFSVSYTSIVKTGEETGTLARTMKNLAAYLENTEKIKDKVKNALTYPFIILFFSLLVITVVVMFIIPKFKKMFLQAQADLPWLTQVIVNTSELLLEHTMFIVVGGFLFSILMGYLCSRRKVRNVLDALVLKVPIMGKDIIHKFLISRFCRTLSVLLNGGVGISTSLHITSQVLDHYPMQKAIEQIRSRVVSGAFFSDELRAHKIFPRLVSKMTAVGERSGSIDGMLMRTAEYYDEELENTIQKLTVLIEPVLIVFIGAFICLIVVALYLPIFKITRLVA